jgi:hypothetical protein
MGGIPPTPPLAYSKWKSNKLGYTLDGNRNRKIVENHCFECNKSIPDGERVINSCLDCALIEFDRLRYCIKDVKKDKVADNEC